MTAAVSLDRCLCHAADVWISVRVISWKLKLEMLQLLDNWMWCWADRKRISRVLQQHTLSTRIYTIKILLMGTLYLCYLPLISLPWDFNERNKIWSIRGRAGRNISLPSSRKSICSMGNIHSSVPNKCQRSNIHMVSAPPVFMSKCPGEGGQQVVLKEGKVFLRFNVSDMLTCISSDPSSRHLHFSLPIFSSTNGLWGRDLTLIPPSHSHQNMNHCKY